MTLSMISPFSYQNFETKFREFAAWIAAYIQTNQIHEQSGWLNQLKSYDYNKTHTNTSSTPCWQQGILSRDSFYTQLNNPTLTDVQLIDVVNNIISKWGHMYPPYSLSSAALVRKALKAISSITNTSILTDLIIKDLAVTGRVAARSKIFEMYVPTKWVIYDSRVANALACLTSKFTNNTPDILSWPIPQGRGKNFSRAPGYGGCHTKDQGSLGFIYASWLCYTVADTLRSNVVNFGCPTFSYPAGTLSIPTNTWQTYHVEMVLFMIGKECF
ncbi:hypothetical protein A3K80_00040 [Candidatus Bathyarchaeota archaeon RBG_13_38_9]|nr:MAG: hypothetical protein A3K80_00040 [Candidatus Bathyarchaeota archaeon RBG_13_38_9]